MHNSVGRDRSTAPPVSRRPEASRPAISVAATSRIALASLETVEPQIGDATPMPSRLVALTVDAFDPPGLARFWAGVLGWETTDDGRALVPDDDTGFSIRFRPTSEP